MHVVYPELRRFEGIALLFFFTLLNDNHFIHSLWSGIVGRIIVIFTLLIEDYCYGLVSWMYRGATVLVVF